MKSALLRHLLAIVSVAACTHAGAVDLSGPAGMDFHVGRASMKEMRFRSTLRQQYDFSCGSAAVATLLTYHYGYPVSEQAVFEQMYLHGDQQKIRREGFSLLDMQRYLASQGFRADGFRLPLQRLADANLPAIVLVSEKGYHHFVVVKGVSRTRVLLGDPASGTRAITRAAFESVWTNKLLFVIHDQSKAVAFNHPSDWRVAPAAPLAEGIERDALSRLTLPKLGPGDF